MAHDFAFAKSSVLDFCEKKGRNGGFGCGNKRRFFPDALQLVIMHPHHNPVHVSEDYDENNNAKAVTHLPYAEGKQLFNYRNNHRQNRHHFRHTLRQYHHKNHRIHPVIVQRPVHQIDTHGLKFLQGYKEEYPRFL